MNENENHSPDNRSEEYLYTPRVDDYGVLYRECLIKTKMVKKDRRRFCIRWEIYMAFISLVVDIVISTKNLTFAGSIIFCCYPIAAIVFWFVFRSLYYQAYIASVQSSKLHLDKRRISFDGYHLVIEGDRMTVMFPTRRDFEATFYTYGIIVRYMDTYRYFPKRIFGSVKEMADFYDRLTWNKEYENKYNTRSAL